MDSEWKKCRERLSIEMDLGGRIGRKEFPRRNLNLNTLPSICLQRILSFLSYEKVSQLRLVTKTFNEVCEIHFSSDCQQLDEDLNSEIERIEKSFLVPSYQRASFDTVGFFSCLRRTLVYLSLGEGYFVAGKILDETKCFFMNFRTPTTPVPFVIEDPYIPTSHPLLLPLYKLRMMASSTAIKCNRLIVHKKWGDKINLRMKLHDEGIIMSKQEKEQKQKIFNGEQMNREFHNAILRLNQSVLDLTKDATEVYQEVDILLQQMGRSPPTLQLITCDITSNKMSEKVKWNKERPNLLSLPPICNQIILSYLTYEKVSQLRGVCKTFDKVCKTVLTEGVEEILKRLGCENDFDPMEFLLYCRDTFRCGMGREYYFSAGKVLDVVKIDEDIMKYIPKKYFEIKSHVNPIGFTLIDYVVKATTHFRNNILPKYFPDAGLLQSKPCEDFGTFSDTKKCAYKPEYELNIKELGKMIADQEVAIKKLNERNTKALKVFVGLKKSLKLENEKVSGKRRILNEIKNRRSFLDKNGLPNGNRLLNSKREISL